MKAQFFVRLVVKYRLIYVSDWMQQGCIQSSSSDLQKSLKRFKICICLFLRFLIAVREINYPSCFIVYYEIKVRKNLLDLVIPLITQANPALDFSGEFDEFFSFVDISENNVITFVGRRKFVRRGWDWMVYGSFHKSLKTLFDWTETLILSCELLKLDCDWLSRVANYRGNYWKSIYGVASPRKSLRLFLCRRLCRVHRWLATEENYKLVRGDPVCRKEDCSQYDIGLVFKEISSYSDQDKLFDFPSSVECSNSNRHLVWGWLKRFPWLAYSKYLDGAFCLPCVFFGVQCGRNTNKLDKLYKFPLTMPLDVRHFTFYQNVRCII